MRKYGTSESLEVFVGKEAQVVNEHMQRLGKSVSDFTHDEITHLQKDLESVRDDDVQVNRKAAQVEANGGPTAVQPTAADADEAGPQEVSVVSEDDATASVSKSKTTKAK